MSRVEQQSDFLMQMAHGSQMRLLEAQAKVATNEIERLANEQLPAPAFRLSADGFDLIAEVKKHSPSAGELADENLVPAAQAAQYAAAGAAAISVLTEPSRFAGSLGDLRDVVACVGDVPVMRKDFLVDPYQVFEARAAGAGGVLLIAAILEPEVLKEMLSISFDLGMFALVEAFDVADLERCVPVMEALLPGLANDRPERMLLGINCRNLRTLEVEFGRFAELAGKLPAGIPWAAESGVATPEDAASVAQAGYRLALVGTALMQADNPSAAAAALLQAGRAAAAC
ncbi:MAG: indole-3-glycerol phosphate synthase TrpC [Gammaproteobacteria bacterium]|nr:indole-3-glycerol phosphate synthase TrpC [Gammaproteobacteria bacterium]